MELIERLIEDVDVFVHESSPSACTCAGCLPVGVAEYRKLIISLRHE